jgi:hypothetical protein
LTGDSHAIHFANMMDSSSVIKNLYYSRAPSCLLVDAETCRNSELAESSIPERVNLIHNLKNNFQTIYYIMSFALTPESKNSELIEKNLEKYIQSIGQGIKIILIAPNPYFPIGANACIFTDSHCTVKKEKNPKRRSVIFSVYQRLQNRFDNVYIYDPFHAICPGKECIVYDEKKDFLWYNG